MTLTELRYIVAVARHRHFGHAAEACFVSQPTLSVAVRKLEDELGQPLFERRQNEVAVTPFGEQVVAQAQVVLEQVERIRQLAEQEKGALRSPLRLGLIYTIGPYLTPHLIPELHRSAPEMPLLIREDFTANLAEALKRGEVDAIVVSLPFEAPGIEVRPLYDEPFVLALPSDHPLARRRRIDPKMLAEETVLLLTAGNCFRDQVVEICPECLHRGTTDGYLLQALEGSSLETIRQMVASGVGVTVLPVTSTGGNRDLEGLLSFREFTRPVPSRRVALAWRRSFPRKEAIEALAEAIGRCELEGVLPIRD